jgi:hypothetical protein
MKPTEKRMAGDYEVFQSIEIGPREIILCENKDLSPKYVCTSVEYSFGMELYPDARGSDDYIEILRDFVDRINHELNVLEQNKQTDINIITPEQCNPVSDYDSLVGKVVVRRLDTLKREYQSDRNQLYLATGGNGTRAGAMGNAVFAFCLGDKEECRIERFQLLGVIKDNEMPEWAKKSLTEIQNQRKHREDIDAR